MNIKLKDELMTMKQKDFQLRRRLICEGVLASDGYNPEMECLHKENAKRLAEIVDECGWPGVSEVGEDGEEAAWIVAQHSISIPALQVKFLNALKIAVAIGEASLLHEAYLTDRILFNQDKPQHYGMVWDWDENGEMDAKVEDVELTNRQRAALGLPPLAKMREIHHENAMADGILPPADYHEYRRKRLEWARKTGWIS